VLDVLVLDVGADEKWPLAAMSNQYE